MSEHRLEKIAIERPRGGMKRSSRRLKGVRKKLARYLGDGCFGRGHDEFYVHPETGLLCKAKRLLKKIESVLCTLSIFVLGMSPNGRVSIF